MSTRVKTVADGATPSSLKGFEMFDRIALHSHEQVSLWYDPESGYRGIIAIHNTALGPALGGTRFWNYKSDLEALHDVLRLARGMSYKAAIAGLDLGGGKSVIIGDNKTTDREGLFRQHGKHVDCLQGRYITAEDVGTSPPDMEWIRQETEHVVGLADALGDPSPVTAYGTFRGMQACAQFRWGDDSLDGKTVTVQGVGHVGYYLCELLHEAGAKLIVTDIDEEKVHRVVKAFGATAVGTDEIYARDADIFAPCALGAVVNDDTVNVLKVEIIAGAANNQLAEERHGDLLEERDIVYAPDYAINGGGLINVHGEIHGWQADQARNKAGEIYDTVLRILTLAREEGLPSYRAADRVAEERFQAAERERGLPHRA